MGWVVAFAGAKGGAGKTTSATGLAVAAARAGANVKLGDMDAGQWSSFAWGERRKANGYEPKIIVEQMVNEKAIALARELVDLLVLDLPGRADALTHAVAKESDLVVVVTDTNALELEPTVALLRALKAEGLDAPRVVVALTKVRDDKRENDARHYLDKAGFKALRTPMMDFDSVHDIANDGRSPVEAPNEKASTQARSFIDGLMKSLQRATEHIRERAGAGKDRESRKERSR